MMLTDQAMEMAYSRLGDIAKELGNQLGDGCGPLYYGQTGGYVLLISPDNWDWDYVQFRVSSMLQELHIAHSIEREDWFILFWIE